jgi:hypothetical protein
MSPRRTAGGMIYTDLRRLFWAIWESAALICFFVLCCLILGAGIVSLMNGFDSIEKPDVGS